MCQALPAMGMKGRSEKQSWDRDPVGLNLSNPTAKRIEKLVTAAFVRGSSASSAVPQHAQGCVCVVTAAELLQATGPSPSCCSGHSFNQSKLPSRPTPLALSDSQYRPSALPS